MALYKAFNVGDGLFSTYSDMNNQQVISRSIFDIGYSQQGLFTAVENDEYLDSSTLLISHFHRDHFKGIYRLENNSLELDQVIIPRLPLNEVLANGIRANVALQLFYQFENTGFYETDILRSIANKSATDFDILRLSQADDPFTASNEQFQVIWPNLEYIAGLRSIQIALNSISEVLDENEGFNAFYTQVLDSDFLNEEIVDSNVDLDQQPVRYDIALTNDQRTRLRRASTRLIRLANDVCLAFYSQNHFFLSLGDLSDRALWQLCENIFIDPAHFRVINSAHHGTHSTDHENWSNITANVVCHSNGARMSQYYRGNAYQPWSIEHHQTFFDGHFVSRTYLLDNAIDQILAP